MTKPRTTGVDEETVVAGEQVRAFVPNSLPPSQPPLDLDGELAERVSYAEEQLKLLELAGELVPSVEWFVYSFVRKEAVLSAQIEGTQATLLDLLEVEISSDAPRDAEVEEVCAYLDALTYAWAELDSGEGLPLSMRLLSDAHRRLLSGTRGAHKQPGEIRRSQNWIGGTRPGNAQFVPPPPHRLARLLAEFESFIHEESALPPLVRVGLLHAQFETLHPFLDGNGRLGRLLITLLLKHWDLLPQPLLYLSLFLKVHRQEYYRRLDAVRSEGDWEGWLAFFLEGVASVAAEAVETARNLNTIVKDCETRLLAQGETTLLSLRLLKALPEKPIVTVTRAVEILGCSRPAATKAIKVLVEAEVLRVDSARTKNREYRFDLYLDELRKGTELS